jgi:hypothetical protein
VKKWDFTSDWNDSVGSVMGSQRDMATPTVL